MQIWTIALPCEPLYLSLGGIFGFLDTISIVSRNKGTYISGEIKVYRILKLQPRHTLGRYSSCSLASCLETGKEEGGGAGGVNRMYGLARSL